MTILEITDKTTKEKPIVI